MALEHKCLSGLLLAVAQCLSLSFFQGSPATWLAPTMALRGSSGLKSETGWVH